MKRIAQNVVPRVAPALAALILAACSSTPRLTPPMLATPSAFKEAQQPVLAADGTQWRWRGRPKRSRAVAAAHRR